jgi:hypothetical protein
MRWGETKHENPSARFTRIEICKAMLADRYSAKLNFVAFSPQANYTD